MAEPRQERIEDKRRVEAMVTAVLTRDAFGQAAAADGLTEGEERYVRAGASIVAGLFTTLGKQVGVAPSKLWRQQIGFVTQSRGDRG